jgi:hypothetical protein
MMMSVEKGAAPPAAMLVRQLRLSRVPDQVFCATRTYQERNYIFRYPYHLMHTWRMLAYSITSPSAPYMLTAIVLAYIINHILY